MKDKIKNIPESPGVYKFFSNKELIYIGKAKNLKKRTSSYFGKSLKDRKTNQIRRLTDHIEIFITNNENAKITVLLKSIIPTNIKNFLKNTIYEKQELKNKKDYNKINIIDDQILLAERENNKYYRVVIPNSQYFEKNIHIYLQFWNSSVSIAQYILFCQIL